MNVILICFYLLHVYNKLQYGICLIFQSFTNILFVFVLNKFCHTYIMLFASIIVFICKQGYNKVYMQISIAIL